MVYHLTVNMQITNSQTERKKSKVSFILVCISVLVPLLIRGDEWPSGSYGFPKPKSGCPGSKDDGWREGWIYQDMEDSAKSAGERSRLSGGSHMDVTLLGPKKDVNRTFCMKENTETQTKSWPKGSYCIYLYNGLVCPKDMKTGWVRWDDEDYKNNNKKGGFLPSSVLNRDTKIYYCCQPGGHWYDSIELPVSKPFYLLTSSYKTDTPKCQMVKWAFSYLEYIVFDTEDTTNLDNQNGVHLFSDGEKKYYCYYEDCRRTMTETSGSFTSHKVAVSEMDPRSQYCSWLITLAETYIISLNFKKLTIPSCSDTFLKIYDGSNTTAPLLGTYCGSNASTEIVVLSSTNSLSVVLNSGSYKRDSKTISENPTFHAQYNAVSLSEIQSIVTSTKQSTVNSTKQNTVNSTKQSLVNSAKPPVDNSRTSGSDSRVIVIASTGGGIVIFCIVIVGLLIKYKRRKQASKLSPPVNISMTDETLQESLPIDQDPTGYETVARVNRTYNGETKASEADDISGKDNRIDYEDVGGSSGTQETYKYETPSQNKMYEKQKKLPENPVYTELDKSRRQSKNESIYQKLIKQDSDYVIPGHEKRDSYEDIKIGKNLPDYKELDPSKREVDDYQTLRNP